jgi:fluoride exporter
MWTYTLIAGFGVLGCWARYGTMGFLFVETLERLTVSPALRAGILTGFIGGYTTFSTFEMEILLLVEQGAPFKALFYTLLSVILGFTAAFGGAYIAPGVAASDLIL